MKQQGYWNGHTTDLAKIGDQNRKHSPKSSKPFPPAYPIREALENWRKREDSRGT